MEQAVAEKAQQIVKDLDSLIEKQRKMLLISFTDADKPTTFKGFLNIVR